VALLDVLEKKPGESPEGAGAASRLFCEALGSKGGLDQIGEHWVTSTVTGDAALKEQACMIMAPSLHIHHRYFISLSEFQGLCA
jgi:hypothetical protein